MTALKANEVERFIAKPDRSIVLVYGPDAGLVRERAEALIRASVDNIDDPFALVRLESEDLSANPARLVEEAHTVPLFGGRRAVWLRVNSRHNIVPAIEALIAEPSKDCRVVIEAGELRKNAPLRGVFEKAKNAVALPCYSDNAQALGVLIDQEMRGAGLTLTPEARALLTGLLGGDRLASRSELHKLALYATGKERVERDDVLAVVTDASAQAMDDVLDAAFAGKTAVVETEFGKARAGGSSPAAIMSAALRQVAHLHRMRLAMEGGESAEAAMKYGAPPVHFSREAAVGTALRSWTSERLVRAMGQLAQASLDTRKQPALAESIAQRTLLSLAVSSRRREA